VGKGYAEGPAVEEAEARRDALERAALEGPRVEARPAVYGSTREEPERHFLGWLGEVDPDELFASGAAYGLVTMPRTPGPDGRPADRAASVTRVS
jgi:hypothetical protein